MTDEQTNSISASDDFIYSRVALAEKLPLKTPFSVDYFLVNACNLRCVFCGYSSSNEEYRFNKRISLNLSLFKQSIDGMKMFPQKIKTIHFMGYGEPLMHKGIAEMVAYTVGSNVAEKVDVVTNGTLLSNKVSDDLIAAKLDWLRISLNGLSADEYKNNCGVNLDFSKFVDNIVYFFNHRGSTKVYIKIFDYMVATEERKKIFYDMFGPICDALSIEHLGDYVEGIDFSKVSDDITGLSLRGAKNCAQKVCPMPFYMLRINPDGKCTPCCEPRLKISLGDISKAKLPDIWNGVKSNHFRYAMLDGANKMAGVCKTCQGYKNSTCPEDVLDGSSERLKQHYR